MHRRRFLGTAATVVVGHAAMPSSASAADPQDAPKKKVEKGPPLDGALVREFVVASHGDPPKVEEMLKKYPALVNAVWDWGGGDFESALGGAAHMGRADIARLLLSRGARLDLFAAAMLGELAIVEAALTCFPDARNVRGPHGIPLLAHAKAGGAAAEPVARFLEGGTGVR